MYYKNNRGSFWELENRIIGRKKKNNVLRPIYPGPERTTNCERSDLFGVFNGTDFLYNYL